MVWSWMMAVLEGYFFARHRPLLTDHVGNLTFLGFVTLLWYFALGVHFARGYRVRRHRKVSDGEFDSSLSPQ
jgi:hypothetical protein